MKSIILVTMNGSTEPYKFVETVSSDTGISVRTIFYHFKKYGFYDKNGIKIEKKLIKWILN
mgnify:CR=1 FL=1